MHDLPELIERAQGRATRQGSMPMGADQPVPRDDELLLREHARQIQEGPGRGGHPHAVAHQHLPGPIAGGGGDDPSPSAPITAVRPSDPHGLLGLEPLRQPHPHPPCGGHRTDHGVRVGPRHGLRETDGMRHPVRRSVDTRPHADDVAGAQPRPRQPRLLHITDGEGGVEQGLGKRRRCVHDPVVPEGPPASRPRIAVSPAPGDKPSSAGGDPPIRERPDALPPPPGPSQRR